MLKRKELNHKMVYVDEPEEVTEYGQCKDCRMFKCGKCLKYNMLTQKWQTCKSFKAVKNGKPDVI
ncbi:MAG: hypothetical protein K6B75_06055 [Lachnospiraceae bacterium]|nr:hypothetical protein [Lachnospiraceae bacterium]